MAGVSVSMYFGRKSLMVAMGRVYRGGEERGSVCGE
jgi:hypothetical protein